MQQYNALVTEKLRLISDVQKLRLKIDAAKKANEEIADYRKELNELLLKLEYINFKIQTHSRDTG